ncbi:hypothetical protein F0562_029856 [Nyssa sinensis]|uniref:Uncharacterized protein n=1 Tax=Nyssa sinensis TaxID=561372 RepID=A0A5J5AX75_9ASTE|nr:hypothetical protein F0562_029856 [Nyssa sinensis]
MLGWIALMQVDRDRKTLTHLIGMIYIKPWQGPMWGIRMDGSSKIAFFVWTLPLETILTLNNLDSGPCLGLLRSRWLLVGECAKVRRFVRLQKLRCFL